MTRTTTITNWAISFGIDNADTSAGSLTDRADAVSAVLMHDNVINEFMMDAGTKSGTDWVVTFPTKFAYVGIDTVNATTLFTDCLNKGVIFVTGRTFDPDNIKDDHLRLSFSNMPKDSIEKGVILLSQVIKNQMQDVERLEFSRQN